MQREEVAAVGDLAREAAVALVAQTEHVHAGIARRVWLGIGPLSAPVRLIHDGVARGVYWTTRRSLDTSVRATAALVAVTRSAEAPSIQRSRRARQALGILGGVLGDRLAREGSALALPMALRAGGTDVGVSADELARAYPHATGRLVVFLHGFGLTEDSWNGRSGASYGDRLAASSGYTPLYVRYNTGRPVDDNGRLLARLLAATVERWPVPVREVALVGHSMGGLVARSALAAVPREPWIAAVRHLVTLGTPHEGTALELAARTLAGAMTRLPEARPLAAALELRSAGIRDFGRGSAAPFAPGVRCLFISGGATVVGRPSAWAQRAGERLEFPTDSYLHIAGVSSRELTDHPAVFEQLRRRLDPPALPAPRRELPAPVQRP